MLLHWPSLLGMACSEGFFLEVANASALSLEDLGGPGLGRWACFASFASEYHGLMGTVAGVANAF